MTRDGSPPAARCPWSPRRSAPSRAATMTRPFAFSSPRSTGSCASAAAAPSAICSRTRCSRRTGGRVAAPRRRDCSSGASIAAPPCPGRAAPERSHGRDARRPAAPARRPPRRVRRPRRGDDPHRDRRQLARLRRHAHRRRHRPDRCARSPWSTMAAACGGASWPATTTSRRARRRGARASASRASGSRWRSCSAARC